MQIFERRNLIDVDLGNTTMTAIMNFPTRDKASSEGFYLKELYTPNHLQIGVVASRTYTSGVHDFKYDAHSKRIEIFSRYENKAYLVYLYLALPLITLIFGTEAEDIYCEIIGLTIALFIFLSLILIFGIRSESKEIEREMVLRINYLRRR